jgi:hypothetical protein
VRWLRDPHDSHGDTMPGMGIQLRELAPEILELVREFVSVREPLFHDE